MRKINKTKLAFSVITALVLSGCGSHANIPKEKFEINKYKIKDDKHDEWSVQEPAITYVKTNSKLTIKENKRIPEKYRNIDISTDFTSNLTLKDLRILFKKYGLYLVIPEIELQNKPIVMIEFTGKFGDFITAMESAYDFSFNFKSGNIVVAEPVSSFILKIPQNKDIAEQIKEDISSLGAISATYSVNASSIFYKASQSNHQYISEYLERLNANTSLVSMQVAIVSVRMNKNEKNGIDWSRFNANFGVDAEMMIPNFDKELSPNLFDAAMNPIQGSVGGTSSELVIGKGDFRISSVIDYLSSYGETEATQSLIMKSLSGKSVTMQVGDKVPYISEISADSGGEDEGDSSSIKIEHLDLGTKLNLLPWFDSDSQLVTIDFNMEISSLTKWITIQAGNQLGSLTQPQTRDQEFSDVVKLRAGESVVIGGISFDEQVSKLNSPSFASDAEIAHTDNESLKHSTFIIIRPTVTIFKGND